MPAIHTRSLRQTGPEAAATSEDDTLAGANGVNDNINGKGGDDRITGLGGADKLAGGTGDDTIFGGSGADSLTGEDGDDFLSGGSGADYLMGAGGTDELRGGSGDDVLRGGKGRDLLTGGAGEDHFVYTTFSDSDGTNYGFGADRITDFVFGVDKLDLSGLDSDLSQPGFQNVWVASGLPNTPGLITAFAFGSGTVVTINLDDDDTPEMMIFFLNAPTAAFSGLEDFVI